MNGDDRRKLVTTLVAVYGYYGKEIPEVSMQFWIDDLAGYPIEAIEAAFVRHRRDPERGRFCPLTADILRQLEGDASDKATLAWGEVLAAAQGGGGRFEGATQAAIDAIGGMGRIRLANASENGFLQREFAAAFKAYRGREEREAVTAEHRERLAADPRFAAVAAGALKVVS